MFHMPTQETALTKTNAVKNRGFATNEGEWTRKVKIRTGKEFCREKIQLDFYILSAALGSFRMKRQTDRESGLWSHEKNKINANNPLSQNLLSTVPEHLPAWGNVTHLFF